MLGPMHTVGIQPVAQPDLTELTSFLWELHGKKPGDSNTGAVAVQRKSRSQPGIGEGVPEQMWMGLSPPR